MQQQTQKQDIIIKKVLNNGANSRERLHQLQKEQQYLSETFKIDKFYNNQKLDISTLKNKINQIKRKADEQQQQSIKEVQNQVRNQVQNQVKNQVRNQVHNKKVQFKQNPQQLKQILIPLNNRIQRLFLYKKQRIKINSGVVNREIQIRSSRNMRNSSAFDKKPNINLIATQNTITISNRDRINDNYKTKNKSSLQTSQQLQHYAIKPNGRYKSNDKNRTISNLSRNSNKNYYQQVQQQSNSQQQTLKLRQSQIPKIQSIGRRRNFQTNQKQKQPQKQKQRQGNLTRLQPISCFKRKLTFIKIQSAQQLKQFQTNINSLWNVYQKLSKIVQILSYQSKSVLDQSLISQQFISILLQYKTEVCSTKLQFLIKIIDTCLQYSHAKIVILSRLLQNLSVVYIFLQILQQTLYNANNKNKANQFNSSHLVNFVGICSNNILLIIRLITLVSVISSKIILSENTSNIFRAILQFQITSYRAELNSIKDTIIRIQHNNQLTTIIQSKINNKMYTRQYHKGFFGKLVKGVLIDRLKQQIQVVEDKFNVSAPQTKPFFQYSYLFFQYLAFHIHQQQCLGLFPKQIQTAPEPYLPLTKQFTIIIDPTRVLVHQGKNKIFVRAYAQEFLQALSQKCNIIFWNQRMPNQIDSLCDLVDVRLDQSKLNAIQIASSNLNSSFKDQIKRLYKHHCFYDYNSKGQLSLVKDVSRIGSSSGKYIIFDTKFDSYYARQEARTILLPWKGEQKDLKLAVVLQILLPFFRQGANLDKSLKLLKPQLYQLLRVKKNRDINKAI